MNVYQVSARSADIVVVVVVHVQVQALRLLRQLLLNTQLRSALLGAGLVEEVVGLLRGSPYGGIRVEAMATLGHALDEPGKNLGASVFVCKCLCTCFVHV